MCRRFRHRKPKARVAAVARRNLLLVVNTKILLRFSDLKALQNPVANVGSGKSKLNARLWTR
jgi:hypothetical protein